jgi:site-specific recombinase XerD
MGCTPKTMEFYRPILAKFNAEFDSTNVTRQSIEKFLNRIPASHNNLHNRHAHYRTLKAFYNWASKEYGIDNPMASIQAPILSKVILSTLTETQIRSLLDSANNLRDKAIISTFTESGLRLSELATIKITDINFENHTIRVFGKGRKEAFAPFGDVSEQYLKAWLAQYQSDSGNIWGIQRSGVVLMLRRLEAKTGITCNPHTFRRTFAVLLRKAGIDTMTIKELGRWESLEMVQRYTRSFGFHDSMKFYKSPLS